MNETNYIISNTKTNEIHTLASTMNMEEVGEWILNNLNLQKNWLITLGKQETLFRFNSYRVSSSPSLSIDIERMKHFVLSNRFVTKSEALADYNKYKNEAEKKLATIIDSLNKLREELDFDLSYFIDGDTYGIDEDFQYISVSVGGYKYYAEINLED